MPGNVQPGPRRTKLYAARATVGAAVAVHLINADPVRLLPAINILGSDWTLLKLGCNSLNQFDLSFEPV